jgi:hypothetical protein
VFELCLRNLFVVHWTHHQVFEIMNTWSMLFSMAVSYLQSVELEEIKLIR